MAIGHPNVLVREISESWSYSSLESISIAHFEAKSHVIIIEGLCIEVDNIKKVVNVSES